MQYMKVSFVFVVRKSQVYLLLPFLFSSQSHWWGSEWAAVWYLGGWLEINHDTFKGSFPPILWVYILYFFHMVLHFLFVLFIVALYKSLQNNQTTWNLEQYFSGKKLHKQSFSVTGVRKLSVSYQRSFAQVQQLFN